VAERERTSIQVSTLAVSTSETRPVGDAVVVERVAVVDLVVVDDRAVAVTPVLAESVAVWAVVPACGEIDAAGGAGAATWAWCHEWAIANPRAAIATRPSTNRPRSTRVSGMDAG
jgi:hypothetical protein